MAKCKALTRSAVKGLQASSASFTFPLAFQLVGPYYRFEITKICFTTLIPISRFIVVAKLRLITVLTIILRN